MRKNPHLILVRSFLFLLTIASSHAAVSQTKSQVAYVSPVDQELSVRSITVAPLTDNVSGIYSNPLGAELNQKFTNDPQWALKKFPDRPIKSERLDAAPDEVKKILKETSADSLLTGRILKGPAGITLKLALYVGNSGLPFVVDETVEPTRFETERIREVLFQSLARLRSKMPYQGILLSRRGQQVTLNLGKNEGLRDGSNVSVIQILKLHRHPKHGFMVGADKEILGKVKVFKADDELSFGNVIFEKETGVLVTGMKVLPDEVVRYPEPVTTAEGQAMQDLAARGDKPVAFGEKPVEWLPEPAPQYGRVQVSAGIGQYTHTAGLQTSGSQSGSNSFAPNLGIMGEGWLNRDWWVGFSLRQSAFSIENKLTGSSPSKLGMSLSKYDVTGGYNFLLGNDFFGPKIQVSAGLGKFSARVDESTPLLYSNSEFGGMLLGFTFNTPISEESPWDIGAKFKYFWSPNVSESITSGSKKSVSVNDFSFLIAKRVRQNFRYIGEFNMEYYNADFDGSGPKPEPVNNISHRINTIMIGLEYLF